MKIVKNLNNHPTLAQEKTNHPGPIESSPDHSHQVRNQTYLVSTPPEREKSPK
ncbi:hypothetical protein BDV40DRAFT_276445 [Aspergillus tamarii]|uniref:Uncharacterized protein n=1 Tax=Aspergillus tamarii TaxID=41984 RepID=A0A5N6UIB0_ASPTM|nr:hypothetical protein BDV40DRAFT_276445 [Aspergillus tamarii]